MTFVAVIVRHMAHDLGQILLLHLKRIDCTILWDWKSCVPRKDFKSINVRTSCLWIHRWTNHRWQLITFWHLNLLSTSRNISYNLIYLSKLCLSIVRNNLLKLSMLTGFLVFKWDLSSCSPGRNSFRLVLSLKEIVLANTALVRALFLCFNFIIIYSWVKLGHHCTLPRFNALSLDRLCCWLRVIHWKLFSNSILNI